MRAHDPVAIVGIACRFPGGAHDARSFWDLLRSGTDAITEVPPERWNADRFHHPDASAPGRMVTRWGGFVAGIDSFDAAFFGISPREAARMDPQQRWLAEVAWEAMEDAGVPPEHLAGTKTGVFVGISHAEYPSLIRGRHSLDGYVNSGSALSIAANRLSYLFHFRGPSMAVDTACSSSLVALHLAARSLQSGECEAALVGGANALLTPEASIGFSQARMLSPRGRCRTFDADADGYVRSEGAAAVLLMRSSTAKERGLHPRALLMATSTNQDGRSSSLTVPSQRAQEEMILDALRESGVHEREVVYVEAHGTGTTVGDRIEIRALASTVAKERPPGRPLLIGSVKTNIGHLEPASGLAGLLKSVLVLEHRAVPPNLHFERPNPRLPLEWMKVPTSLTPLPVPDGGTPFVAVNSFGFGGTNAHALLAPASASEVATADATPHVCILPLSARSGDALQHYVGDVARMLENGGVESLDELCAAFAFGKSHHTLRKAFVAKTGEAMLAALRAHRREAVVSSGAPPKIAFVFSGQGSQWWRMGRELYESEPLVRDLWKRCDTISRSLGGPSILDALLGVEEQSRLDHTDIAQPALFALQASLVELWRSRGIEADVVIGHSVGEAAAAWASGALSLEEIVPVIIHRSRRQESTRGAGRMLVASISTEEAARWVRELEGRVSVAAFNAPRQLTLAGSEIDLQKVAEHLATAGVFCRFLPAPYAFHSPSMDSILDGLRRDLSPIRGRAGAIPMISTVTGEAVGAGDLDAEYWCRNVRQPVRFAAAIERAIANGCNAFVEIGPHPVLAAALAEISTRAAADAAIVPSLRRGDGEAETMLSSLAALYERGASVRWDALYARPSRRVELPAYPWQRQRLWHDASVMNIDVRQAPAHPLLGDRQDHPQPTWIQDLDVRLVPWLSDHRVGGTVVVPAAAYLEMATAAIRQLLGDEQVLLEDVRFPRLLLVPDEHSVRTCVRLDPAAGSFHVLSSAGGSEKWEVHAEGLYRRGRLHEPPRAELDALQLEFDESRSQDEVYRELSGMGQTYGAAFRGVHALLLDGNQRALGFVRDPAGRDSTDYVLFPPSLDSCFHPAVALKDEHGKPDRAVIVVSLRQLRVFRKMPEIVWSHVRIVERRGGVHVGDFTLYDSDGFAVAQARGLAVREVAPEKKSDAFEERLYAPAWESVALDPAETPLDRSAALVFCDARGIGARVAEELRKRGVSVNTVAKGLCDDATGLRVDPSRARWAGELFEALRARGGIPPRVVYLWGRDAADAEDHGCDALLELVRARIAIGAADDVQRWLVATADSSALWGFVRTMQSELPQWQASLLDVEDDDAVGAIAGELDAAETEPEVLVRGTSRAVRRLKRLSPSDDAAVPKRPPAYVLRAHPGNPDSLSFAARPRRAPAAGEVEVEIAATGVNFRDLMKVLGIYPSAPGELPLLGDEWSGTIVRCGPRVRNLAPGDRVMGFAPAGGAFGSHLLVPAEGVWKIPEALSFAEAATIPVAFGTAYHALHTLARLRRSETVLIHAAAGGVGLAAVQLAQRIGARVLATAGSETKREYLQSLGVERVMDSRSLDFADEVLRFTGGRGVDVVLNSLAGAFQQKTLEVCAPHGRFVEIGKRDLYQNGSLPLAAFQRSLGFFAFDLSAVLAAPGPARSAVQKFLRHEFVRGGWRPLPAEVFSATEIGAAFRKMQAAEHIGKLVVSFDRQARPLVPAEFWPDPEGTYLLTGGGGFGLASARWLIDRGARRVVIATRRGLVSADDAPTVDSLRLAGASVEVVEADVAEEKALASVLAAIDASPAPLRGVFHAATVLRDRTLHEMTRDDLEAVLRPKLAGAWNLHRQTLSRDLDCFVLFSSVASLFGSPGQANYAAANAALDALAHHRRALGLPGLSVNWGPIGDVGVAARRPELLRYLESTGVHPLTSADALQPLATLLARGEPQVCIADVDWQQLGRASSKFASSPIFRDLAAERGSGTTSADSPQAWRESILALEPAARVESVAELIVSQLATTLGMPAADVDRARPLHGLDSLMAVELKFRIENQTGCELPIDVLNGNLTLVQLAGRLCAQLEGKPSERESVVRPFSVEGESRRDVEAPHLRRVDEPLTDLIAAGAMDRLAAGALMSWPDSLFSQTGVVPREFFERMSRGGVAFDLVIETALGPVGIFMLPLTTGQITPGEASLLPHVLEGVRMATMNGARCVALTGLIPSATGYGEVVRDACAREGLAAVTTGHGTTMAAVVLNLESILDEAGRDLEDETLLVYGVGSIGLGALRLMLDVLPHPAELRLCDPFRSAQFFEELTDSLRRQSSFRGPIRIVEARRHGAADAFYDASVILGATNVADVLDVSRLAPGTLIVDDSAPHCLNGPAALRRFLESNDLLCTEGGFVRAATPMPRIAHVPAAVVPGLPAELPQLLFSMLDPHDITACVLSALLSANRTELAPNIGLVDAPVARMHWDALRELGFEAATLNYEGTPLPRGAVDAFRERFGRADAEEAAAGAP